mmetsp:Transcript_113015/g.258873  ORF Transcript_113015/g.258873 Transcript_113015/m.258873 type:complete len:268 (-) Transcript_113015:216-1019(-)
MHWVSSIAYSFFILSRNWVCCPPLSRRGLYCRICFARIKEWRSRSCGLSFLFGLTYFRAQFPLPWAWEPAVHLVLTSHTQVIGKRQQRWTASHWARCGTRRCCTLVIRPFPCSPRHTLQAAAECDRWQDLCCVRCAAGSHHSPKVDVATGLIRALIQVAGLAHSAIRGVVLVARRTMVWICWMLPQELPEWLRTLPIFRFVPLSAFRLVFIQVLLLFCVSCFVQPRKFWCWRSCRLCQGGVCGWVRRGVEERFCCGGGEQWRSGVRC